jgi:DNA primase
MNTDQSVIKLTENSPPEGKVVATYDYVNEQGLLLFQIVRYAPKAFRTRRLNNQGTWVWRLGSVQPVLYRLTEVIAAHTVVVVEGEKDAETAERLLPAGWAATTSPFGAGQWRNEYSEVLRGKQIFLCPDTDVYGQQHLMQVGLSLSGKAAGIRVVELPKTVKDLTEWIEQGGRDDQFALLLQQAQQFGYPRFDTESMMNIQPLEGALDKLLRLNGKVYEWKEPEKQGNLTGCQMGLIAQEVETVFPDWIGVDTQGFKTLTIKGFEALVIETIKEIKHKNENLRRQCENMEAMLQTGQCK